jgi:hypothetical protein
MGKIHPDRLEMHKVLGGEKKKLDDTMVFLGGLFYISPSFLVV